MLLLPRSFQGTDGEVQWTALSFREVGLVCCLPRSTSEAGGHLGSLLPFFSDLHKEPRACPSRNAASLSDSEEEDRRRALGRSLAEVASLRSVRQALLVEEDEAALVAPSDSDREDEAPLVRPARAEVGQSESD